LKTKLAGHVHAKLVCRVDRNRNKPFLALKRLSESFDKICAPSGVGAGAKAGGPCAFERRFAWRNKVFTQHKFAAHIEGTLIAMKRDERLLGTNFVALSYYLREFFVDFMRAMNLLALAKEMLREAKSFKDSKNADPNSPGTQDDTFLLYKSMSLVFATEILQNLDSGDADLAFRCAEFMCNFFLAIDPRKIMWFTPAA
jgi:hypothetical protein